MAHERSAEHDDLFDGLQTMAEGALEPPAYLEVIC
jgi:hypothetical protein